MSQFNQQESGVPVYRDGREPWCKWTQLSVEILFLESGPPQKSKVHIFQRFASIAHTTALDGVDAGMSRAGTGLGQSAGSDPGRAVLSSS